MRSFGNGVWLSEELRREKRGIFELERKEDVGPGPVGGPPGQMRSPSEARSFVLYEEGVLRVPGWG